MVVRQVLSRLTLCLTLVKILTGDYIQDRNSYCQPNHRSTVNISMTERTALRASNRFGLSFSVSSVVNTIDNRNLGSYFSGSGYLLIIFAVLSVSVLGSAIVFIVSLSCCLQVKGKSDKVAKDFWISALVFWFVIIAGVIAVIIFLTKIQSLFPLMICGVSTFPYNMINGLNTGSIQFLGFNNYVSVMGTFAIEMANFASVQTNLNNIQTVNLPSYAKSAIDGLTAFYNTYSKSTTSDAKNQQSIPYIISNFTNGGVSAKIQAEFDIYWTAASRLNIASTTALTLKDASITSLKGTINQATPFYMGASLNFTTAFNDVLNYFTGIQTYFTIIFASIVIAEVIIVLLMGIALFILMCMTYHQRFQKRVNIMKILLFIIGIIVFLTGMIGTITMFFSLFINTSCSVIDNFLTSPSTLDATFGLQTSPLPIRIAAKCIQDTQTSFLSSLNSTYELELLLMDRILDGITIYKASLPQFEKNVMIFQSIIDTMETWTPVYNGLRFDQPDIGLVYKEFVIQNNVTSPQYVFNPVNCTSSMCFLIQNSSNFVASENANNAVLVKALFTTLQNYILSEIQLIQNMIIALSGKDTGTPNSLLLVSQAKLLGIKNDFNAISNVMPNTMQQVSSFQGGFLNYTNCSFIGNELQDLETTMCFSFKTNFFATSLAFLGTVVMQLFFLWLAWLGFRYITDPREIEYVTTEDQSVLEKNDNEEKDNLKER